MEIKTIRQVSQDYGISRQMLCYYEEIGLIKSSRKNDYAYRVYDEEAIKRLQQIIILRKLQIPMKQIKDILNNQNAVEVIEIFKQNIDELDEKITALSVVKSILARFIDELQEKANLHLKLDLLNDKTMIAVVDSLSFVKHDIKEKVPMEELNKASETLRKSNEKNVRIVNLPPMTWAFAEGAGCRTILKKFIDDVDLFNIKPDTRIFCFDGFGQEINASTIFASIPDDFNVPAPLKKVYFSGGLYAWFPGNFDFGPWLENSEDYEWAPGGGIHRPIMEELSNPYNRFNLNSYFEKTGCTTDSLWPIRKTEKLSGESIKALTELEEMFSRGKTTKIDLPSLINHENHKLNYTSGSMEIKSYSTSNQWGLGLATPQQFDCPLKIELRAKTDSIYFIIKYATGSLIINHPQMPNGLSICDIMDGKFSFYKDKDIPINEFADIEWILGKEFMAIKINGEIRHFGRDYGYIQAFDDNPEHRFSSAVSINTAQSATLTVESLRVTEL